MKQKKLKVEIDWRFVESTEEDIAKLPADLSARMLFQIFLINAFEKSVIDLKSADCVHGPIHISIGQEAVAAAAMAALRDGDMIAGSHRAHHQFLAKALNHAVPKSWNPVKDDLPEEGRE